MAQHMEQCTKSKQPDINSQPDSSTKVPVMHLGCAKHKKCIKLAKIIQNSQKEHSIV